MSGVHYSSLPSVSLNGFLFKTGSMTRVITDRKGKEGGCLEPKILYNPNQKI